MKLKKKTEKTITSLLHNEMKIESNRCNRLGKKRVPLNVIHLVKTEPNVITCWCIFYSFWVRIKWLFFTNCIVSVFSVGLIDFGTLELPVPVWDQSELKLMTFSCLMVMVLIEVTVQIQTWNGLKANDAHNLIVKQSRKKILIITSIESPLISVLSHVRHNFTGNNIR